MRKTMLGWAALAAAMAGAWIVPAQNSGDALLRGFQNPPDSAKPRVWWHWMNGNITKEGIKADLEWMKRVGIGGFQNFDAGLNTPQIVEKRLVYMTPEWKDAFKYAATLADQLGLEMAIAGSPGWSESGGPWVTARPGDEEIRLERDPRGRRPPVHRRAAQAASTTGPYQNLTGRGGGGAGAGAASAGVLRRRRGGRLSRARTATGRLRELASQGDLQRRHVRPGRAHRRRPCQDALFCRPLRWARRPGSRFEFPQPQTVRGLTFVAGGGGGRGVAGGRGGAEQSGTGIERRRPAVPHRCARFPLERARSPSPRSTARFFRVTIRTPAAASRARRRGRAWAALQRTPAAPAGTQIAELVLHTGARVNRFEEKAAFSAATGIYAMATPAVPAGRRRAQSRRRRPDLAGCAPDGTLDWTPPAGPLGRAAPRLFAYRRAQLARLRPRPPAWRWTS